MATHTVKTDQGYLTVKGRLKADGKVSGRVNGVTYIGKTWDEVAKQIVEAHKGRPPMVRFLSVEFERHGERGTRGGWPNEDDDAVFGYSIAYKIVEIGDECDQNDRRGRWVLEPDYEYARFVETDEDDDRVEDTLGDYVRLVPWSQPTQDALDQIILKTRALALALDALLAPEKLPALATAAMPKALEEAQP